MGREWTAAQLCAIESENENLLLSAAAGSGKTAVLTERLIRRLADPAAPLDIRRVLVLTFTRSAAEELSGRIRSSLSDAIKSDPQNAAIKRQLLFLPQAKISTIHSFCLDLVRQNLLSLGLPNSMRLMDEAESDILKKQVMQELIDSLYTENAVLDLSVDFDIFVSHFTSVKNTEELADILISNYKKMLPLSLGIGILKQSSKMIGDVHSFEDFFGSAIGESVCSEIFESFEYFRHRYEEILPFVGEDETVAKNYLASFEFEYAFIVNVLTAIKQKDFEGLRSLFLNSAFPELGRGVRGAVCDNVNLAKSVRGEFLGTKNDFKERYFDVFLKERSDVCEEEHSEITKEQKWQLLGFEGAYARYRDEHARQSTAIGRIAESTSKLLRDLYTIYSEFEKRLLLAKKDRRVMDFSDIEIYTKKLLWDVQNDAPTAFAATVRDRFDEIYIDEYQDINEVQEQIFASIAGENNLFMVGDIKQSIYGFRGASADIFDSKRRLFSEGEGGRLIFLSNNFRSNRSVIDFANFVCGGLFGGGAGGFEYSSNDDLVCSKSDAYGFDGKVCTYIVNGDDDDDDLSRDGAPSAEARFVAQKISSLLGTPKNDGSPIAPEDIVILMRAAKATALDFERALSAHGISVQNAVTKSLFESPEVLMFLALLYTIDNPNRDIYLTAALKSPIFGFSLDELIYIRRSSQNGTLYQALCAFCDEHDMKKAKYFQAKLAEYRYKARTLPTDQLIWYLFCDTGVLAMASKDSSNSGEGRANLLLLYDYARKYEKGGFRGLYNFVSYINDLIENGSKFDIPSAKDPQSSVRIMTVHQSKGLEFPVCFLSRSAKKFNISDTSADFLLDEHLGAALNLCDQTGFANYKTPFVSALSAHIQKRSRAEELRILYVALTRAREQLFITAEAKDAVQYLDGFMKKRLALAPYTVGKCKSFLELIMLSCGEAETEFCKISAVDADEFDLSEKAAIPAPQKDDDTPYIKLRREVERRLSFSYSHKAAQLPSKLSVSKLYPGVLDDAEPSEALEDYTKILAKRPRFMGGADGVGAERGTATHTFMQFCDFECVIKNGVTHEISRLCDLGFITERMAELIYPNVVWRFFESDICKQIMKSKRVWREKRFNVLLCAADFTNDEVQKQELSAEQILVQGVIDCFFEKDDGKICVVDYKTDYFAVSETFTAEDAQKELAARYKTQLLYYKAACEKLTGKEVDELVIYSFSLGKEISVLDF